MTLKDLENMPVVPVRTNIDQTDDNNRMYVIIFIISITAAIILMFWPKQANAQEPPKSQVIDAAIGEAEQGGLKGMRCVISAINNRQSLRGVYGIKSPRVTGRLYSNRTFVLAVQAYEDCKHKDYAKGATFWFSDADMKKAKVWRIIKEEHLVLAIRCEGNNFYKRANP